MHDWSVVAEPDLGTGSRVRPRRLRRSAVLRDLVAETTVQARQLIMPHFVLPSDDGVEPISSMPGIARMGVNDLLRTVERDHALGIRSVLLFGQPVAGAKDPVGTSAHDPEGAVPRALRALRRHFEVDAPHIVVAVLDGLARNGELKHEIVAEAIRRYDIDPDRPDPRTA